MPRFVILEHDYPYPHFDLMLEAEAVLWTWRLPQLPRVGEAQEVERVFDHRLIYLDYEGPISEDRGTVTRRDWGELMWVQSEGTHLEVRLTGERLQGLLTLTQLQGERWRLDWQL